MKLLIISAPRVSNLTQQTCSVEWQPCKAIQGSSLEYVLQLQGEQEYQKVSETKMSTFTVHIITAFGCTIICMIVVYISLLV